MPDLIKHFPSVTELEVDLTIAPREYNKIDRPSMAGKGIKIVTLLRLKWKKVTFKLGIINTRLGRITDEFGL